MPKQDGFSAGVLTPSEIELLRQEAQRSADTIARLMADRETVDSAVAAKKAEIRRAVAEGRAAAAGRAALPRTSPASTPAPPAAPPSS